jgi:hypothetical protein
LKIQYRVRVIIFNATFNNISAISWRSVLLVENITLIVWCIVMIKWLHRLILKSKEWDHKDFRYNYVLSWFEKIVFGFMMLKATSNNISVISWRSVLLVEETGVTEDYNRPVASYWQILSHSVVSSTPLHDLKRERDTDVMNHQIRYSNSVFKRIQSEDWSWGKVCINKLHWIFSRNQICRLQTIVLWLPEV